MRGNDNNKLDMGQDILWCIVLQKNGCICDEIIQNNSCFTGKICW